MVDSRTRARDQELSAGAHVLRRNGRPHPTLTPRLPAPPIGIWGYHGSHEPHSDRFWSLRRHVPVLTVLVGRPQRTRRWWEIVDELTVETGVVEGGLRLAQEWSG